MNDVPENGRLTESWAGTVMSIFLSLVAWLDTHIAKIAGIAAIVASIYAIRASRDTSRWRRKQIAEIERGKNEKDDE